jgi:hypothetical protein
VSVDLLNNWRLVWEFGSEPWALLLPIPYSEALVQQVVRIAPWLVGKLLDDLPQTPPPFDSKTVPLLVVPAYRGYTLVGLRLWQIPAIDIGTAAWLLESWRQGYGFAWRPHGPAVLFVEHVSINKPKEPPPPRGPGRPPDMRVVYEGYAFKVVTGMSIKAAVQEIRQRCPMHKPATIRRGINRYADQIERDLGFKTGGEK